MLSFYSLHTSLTILIPILTGLLVEILFGNWDYFKHKILKSCDAYLLFFVADGINWEIPFS